MKKLFFTVTVIYFALAPLFSGGFKIAHVVDVADATLAPYNSSVRGEIAFEKSYESPGSSFMAVHFNYFKLAQGDYLVLSNHNDTEQYVYAEMGKKDWQGKFMPQFWSRRVKGSAIRVTIYSKNSESLDRSFKVSMDKISCGFSDAEINQALRGDSGRLICGEDDKKWAKCYDPSEMYNKSKAVARLFITGDSACTGWLIGSAGHLLTNYHCFSTQAEADDTEYELMGEGATCETDCTGWLGCRGTVEATSAQFIVTSGSNTLDYTLVKLPTNVTGKYGYLQLRSTVATAGERIYIPQYAQAEGKQLAVADDQSGTGFAKVDSFTTSNVQYMADTEGGSSGSPVIAYSDNLVVGLHHAGACPNLGVKTSLIITSLGSNLPPDAVGGSSSGKEIFVAGFTGAGTWIFDPNTNAWTQLNSADAALAAAGDVNGNGTADLVGVYGTLGLWIRYDNGTWSKVNVSGNPSAMAIGDVDGNGTGEIIGVWTGIGVWAYNVSANTWSKILSKDANQISSGDYDLDGKDEVLGWWSPEGLYQYNVDTSVWLKVLDETSLVQIASGDMNGDSRNDVLGIWTHGVWFYNPANGAWTRLYDTASRIAAGDLNGGGTKDLIGIWDTVAGIWVRYTETGTWYKIHDTKPACFAAGKLK